MTTLFLSQGVPMISGGDELGRTQGGNNNAYCQDNDTSWTHWDLSGDQRAFLEFCCRMADLRRRHPVLRRRNFFQGRKIRGSGVRDIMWLTPSGREMADDEWNADHVRCLGVRLAGSGIEEVDDEGRPIVDETLVYFMNASADPVEFHLPSFEPGLTWTCLVDTSDAAREGRVLMAGQSLLVADRSMALFVAVPD